MALVCGQQTRIGGGGASHYLEAVHMFGHKGYLLNNNEKEK